MEDLTQEEYDKRYKLLHKPKGVAEGTPQINLSHNIDEEKLRKFLPKKNRKVPVTTKVLDMIQNMERDTGVLQEYMEEKVLANMAQLGKFGVSLEQYINAVKFCTLKQHHPLNKSWAITFPMRYKLVCDKAAAAGKEPAIENHASAYDRGALVCAITADMIIEFNIQYAPARHAAMRKLIDLMGGKSADPEVKVTPKVQMDSAVAILDKTEMPADNTLQLKIGMDDESKGIQQNLAEQMAKSAEIQLAALKGGMSLEDVQKLGITTDVIEAEIE